MARPPLACTAAITGARSCTVPFTRVLQQHREGFRGAAAWPMSPSSSTPIGRARVRTTASVCGSTSSATKNLGDLTLPTRSASVIASAAAVASEHRRALAMASP